MFMRENRRKNGAPQPEQTASSERSKQASAKMLDPNEDLGESPLDLRFTPDMSTSAAINEAHYTTGVSGNGPFQRSYEEKIFHMGTKPAPTGDGRELKGR